MPTPTLHPSCPLPLDKPLSASTTNEKVAWAGYASQHAPDATEGHFIGGVALFCRHFDRKDASDTTAVAGHRQRMMQLGERRTHQRYDDPWGQGR